MRELMSYAPYRELIAWKIQKILAIARSTNSKVFASRSRGIDSRKLQPSRSLHHVIRARAPVNARSEITTCAAPQLPGETLVKGV